MLSCLSQTLHLSKASFSCRPDQVSSHCGNNKSRPCSKLHRVLLAPFCRQQESHRPPGWHPDEALNSALTQCMCTYRQRPPTSWQSQSHTASAAGGGCRPAGCCPALDLCRTHGAGLQSTYRNYMIELHCAESCRLSRLDSKPSEPERPYMRTTIVGKFRCTS